MASLTTTPAHIESKQKAEAKRLHELRVKYITAHNACQPLLKLPAELRLHIYSYLLPNSVYIGKQLYEEVPKHEGHYNDRPHGYFSAGHNTFYASSRFPKAFRICRQIREEFVPMYFANTTAVLDVEVLGLTKYYRRKPWPYALCADSIANLHYIIVNVMSGCDNSRLRPHCVTLLVHRRIGHMDVEEDLWDWTSPGCKGCARYYREKVERLKHAVSMTHFLDKDHVLCRQDFKELHGRMERPSWTAGKMWVSKELKLPVWVRKRNALKNEEEAGSEAQ